MWPAFTLLHQINSIISFNFSGDYPLNPRKTFHNFLPTVGPVMFQEQAYILLK